VVRGVIDEVPGHPDGREIENAGEKTQPDLRGLSTKIVSGVQQHQNLQDVPKKTSPWLFMGEPTDSASEPAVFHWR